MGLRIREALGVRKADFKEPARNRFGRMLDHLGIEGAHMHSLRHQFASEALDANPRELANISQVLEPVRPGATPLGRSPCRMSSRLSVKSCGRDARSSS